MHLEILIEEPSAEAALQILIPKIAGPHLSFRMITFQGKHDLLARLPQRMRGYARWLPPDYRIVVVVDEDRQDCRQLKQQLETAALMAGLTTKTSTTPDGLFQVLNRIAVEELEAWFWGDFEALRQAYPRLPATLPSRRAYRNSDAIAGGTAEALERELQRAGYYSSGLAKMQAARDIAPYMQPDRNRSQSFQVFCDGIKALLTRGLRSDIS
ncbi:MAG: DUF4276 family protein [Anaerolineales bacterium]|nr:DUF4276 family protein [Anaerolineales bacterium]